MSFSVISLAFQVLWSILNIKDVQCRKLFIFMVGFRCRYDDTRVNRNPKISSNALENRFIQLLQEYHPSIMTVPYEYHRVYDQSGFEEFRTWVDRTWRLYQKGELDSQSLAANKKAIGSSMGRVLRTLGSPK